ncbi:uncharacterized protein EKO05_0006866 [Ascochyta rabiei]|uniref:Uncharacterized protein n=1 Tax=Didymella rabiei TaxID=5454 RepID=A0A162Z7B4_DIDRA|nr:uncharacterized protein EKO05_0006866 [Ascochyta rabiei]KZM20438.1 hypothetical protein ST47_g8559 [Ascochyta rabiei]UPX16468.1 hypothetical protein EKO05_0006866 [Ascochyta rabiei]
MSIFLQVTLLVSVVAAQLTTSIWLPGAANANQSFVGSVVTQLGDRTTLSVGFDGDAILTEYYGTGPGYVTVGGTTYMAYQATATDPGSDFSVTVDLACSRENGKAAPTCTMTTRNSVLDSSLDSFSCTTLGDSSTSTYVVTDTLRSSISDGLPVTRTIAETVTNGCTKYVGPSVLPQTTTTMSGDEQYFINNYKLIITAGTEKLSASAAVTPIESGAHSTISLVNSTARSSGTAQATGAAAPKPYMAPVLAGLGTAVILFVQHDFTYIKV